MDYTKQQVEALTATYRLAQRTPSRAASASIMGVYPELLRHTVAQQ